MTRIKTFFVSHLFYSFPVQLLIYNIKKNQLLLLLWLILLAIVTEVTGRDIGLPSLFLDPEYRNEVSFWSFAILGVTLGVFMMSYHIICYILDAPRFIFAGNLSRPFLKFFINNSTIPIIFIIIYILKIINFQIENESSTTYELWLRAGGLGLGVIVSATIVFTYFITTNKDIFRIFVSRVDESLKKTKVVRVNVLGRIQDTRKSKIRVDYYLDNFLRFKKVKEELYYDRQAIMKVFDQNHLNAVIIQLSILALIIILGRFRDEPFFQIPAAASFILLFTIFLMIAGALSYWLRGWALTFTVFLVLGLNYAMKNEYLEARYEAYGLNYENEKAEYTLKRVKEFSDDKYYIEDKQETLITLENWKSKFTAENPNKKPKMVFVCVSGGGQRAAVWTMRVLQLADSTLEGKLMKHTMLMTGASGGLVGASYFRELCLQRELYRRGEIQNFTNPYDAKYLDNIAKDNLNAIAFSLVVNDIFFGLQKFKYKGHTYSKDRGYAFEQQLNDNTEGLMDKPLCDYKEPEMLSLIPMLMLAPTIVNDGRRLFISPQNMSYMTVPRPDQPRFLNQKTKGIEFLRFFEEQESHNLRYLSALRMSATFPYVTPNVGLPSEPEMEIMDAGFSDNFGVSDAVRFLYAFRKWVEKNTSGVIFVTIRDTQKDKPIERNLEQSLFQRIFTPVTSLYANLEYLQDISNDNMIEFAQSWFDKSIPIQRVSFQYVPFSKSLKEIEEKNKRRAEGKRKSKNPYKIIKIERAPLSWHLTKKEKESIKRTVYEFKNQYALAQLERLLEDD